MLTLYYAPKTCSLAPYIALEEAGAEFTPYRVNFAEGEQNSAKFKAINPKGRVPALATDKGINVLDSDDVRQGIKEYTNWPTVPQLYVKGEFVGGSDIMMEMFQSGELKQLMADMGVAV